MELNIFMRELQSALVKRGIPDETAARHVSSLKRTFTNDDLSEINAIQSHDEIDELADSIALILSKNKAKENNSEMSQRRVPQPTVQRTNPNDIVIKPAVYEQRKPDEVRQNRAYNKSTKQANVHKYSEYSPDNPPSTKGMLVFWLGMFFTLPITIGLAAVIFGAFAAVFLGLGATIVAGIVALIAVVAAGAGVSLVGIIFGITQLFTFMAAGLYEIGLGVMVAGAVLFVSVLIYNISIRFLPWVITLVGNLLGIVCGKLKDLFFIIRRECYKL